MARTGRRHTKSPAHGPGWLYVAVNPAWPGYCKLGFAKDLSNRLRQMNTNDPFRAYRFQHTRHFDDRKLAEATIHRMADGYRVAGTEWFHLHPDDAWKFLRELSSDPALD